MGMIERMLQIIFGGGGQVVRETVGVFRENAEAGSQRGAQIQQQAMTQFGTEFVAAPAGRFDRIMDGVNRIPRPALALGTLALFVAAMVDPIWFSQRMQGIALVPEPMWWLLGVIVSFYFGARHQVKSQKFHREIVGSLGNVPGVIANIEALNQLDERSAGVADSGTDVVLASKTLLPDANPALEAWRKQHAAPATK